MLYCGLDVGSSFCKCIILDAEKRCVFQSIDPVGGDPETIVSQILKKVFKTLKKKREDFSIEITGRNSENILPDVKAQSEIKCAVIGALHFNPDIKTVFDAGSFTNKVIRIEHSKVAEYIVNDICSSGSGIFLELVCKSLDISLEEMAAMALAAKTIIPITSQCSIFAESEVIYLMNEGKSVADISAGVCNSIIGRMVPLALKVQPKMPMVFIGGVSKNLAIKTMFERSTGFTCTPIPFDSQFITAFGAAILALQNNTK